jgi:hypothetical protein
VGTLFVVLQDDSCLNPESAVEGGFVENLSVPGKAAYLLMAIPLTRTTTQQGVLKFFTNLCSVSGFTLWVMIKFINKYSKSLPYVRF